MKLFTELRISSWSRTKFNQLFSGP